MILAADIGGTHARLLLARLVDDGWRECHRQVYPSRAFPTFEQLLDDFLPAGEPIQAACLGVAGPVLGQRVDITHLPWVLDGLALAARYRIPHLELANDFVVQAWALPGLPADEQLCLQPGQPEPGGVQLLVGAGTGLGIAQCAGRGRQAQVIASEGGHADFAPHGLRQHALQGWLLARLGKATLENVLSGPGLEQVYAFVCHERGLPSAPLAAAAVTAAAEAGDAVALDAIGLFVECYGSTAGNLALMCLPTGGVFLTGGIAPKLARWLQDGRFLAAFHDKALKRDLMPHFPIHIVLNDQLGLIGAAERACALAKGEVSL